MIEATATRMAREFHEFLGRVEHGETVRICKHGRAVARLVPDAEFMSGRRAAELIGAHRADSLELATVDAIEAEMAKLDREQNNALAH